MVFDVKSMLSFEVIVALACVGVVLVLVLLKLWLGQRGVRRGVLLLGLCESGKTLIWSQLVFGRKVETHTSVKENVGDYQTNKGLLKVIDIPGHERLRMKFFDQYKSSARALIFVVDALTFQKDLRDVAEYLYNVLSDSVIARGNPSVLILAHKQDQPTAKGSTLIQTNLERELNLLRDTKNNQLGSLSDKQLRQTYLGKQGKDFTFSQLSMMQIDFAESSAIKENTSGLDDVKTWLASVA